LADICDKNTTLFSKNFLNSTLFSKNLFFENQIFLRKANKNNIYQIKNCFKPSDKYLLPAVQSKIKVCPFKTEKTKL
jgi:hypothetical protein